MNSDSGQQFLRSGRFLVSVGLALCVILVIAYFFYGIQPSSAGGEVVPVVFTISKGESFRGIGARLSQEGLVRSIAVFKTYSLISGSAHRFKPGVYEISRSMSVPQLVSVLTASGSNEVTVTIPEGYSVKDIDNLLSDVGIIDKNGVSNFDFQQIKVEYEFLSEAKSLEGFLFPDTYRFERDTDVKYVVMRLLDTFSDKAWPILRKEDDWMSNLILASFLEREVPDFNDRRMVSGILLNRMRIGMPLQVDATVAYIKCDGGFVLCGEGQILSKKDLSMPSPYNTYQRLGWTPTPIANPGEAAIKATVTPIDSSYIYYLSDPETQNTIFSRTLEEHNVNRVKYL